MDTEELEYTAIRPDWEPLTELHVHAGGALPTSTMWSIAHQQGIRLPFDDFWEFKDALSITRAKMMNLDEFLHSTKNPFHWTEMIQSSPEAMEQTIYEIAAKSYRISNIDTLEIRLTPLKRNRKGEKDLDHIILGALRGLDRVQLEYPMRVGLIFCLEKKFPYRLNEITVEKAIKYHNRGVVGIDLAGLDTHNEFDANSMASIFQTAKDAGLGVTVHAGEGPETLSVKDAVLKLHADRIGHGIDAVNHPEELEILASHGTVMEFCPTSNLVLGLLEGPIDCQHVVETYLRHNIRFTINTDDPTFFQTNLKKERDYLLKHKILNAAQLATCNAWAQEASFLKS